MIKAKNKGSCHIFLQGCRHNEYQLLCTEGHLTTTLSASKIFFPFGKANCRVSLGAITRNVLASSTLYSCLRRWNSMYAPAKCSDSPFPHSPKPGHWSISSLHCWRLLGVGQGGSGEGVAIGEGEEERVLLSCLLGSCLSLNLQSQTPTHIKKEETKVHFALWCLASGLPDHFKVSCSSKQLPTNHSPCWADRSHVNPHSHTAFPADPLTRLFTVNTSLFRMNV